MENTGQHKKNKNKHTKSFINNFHPIIKTKMYEILFIFDENIDKNFVNVYHKNKEKHK